MHTLYLDHSSFEQTFKSLIEQVGQGEWKAPYLRINSDNFKANCALYDDLDGLSITVNDFLCQQPVQLVDKFNEEPLLIIRIMHAADAMHQEHSAPETVSLNAGILLYNHLSPMGICPTVGQQMKWLVLRISPKVLRILQRDIWSLMGEPLQHKKDWVMYESVSHKMHAILKEIWQIQNKPLLSNGITSGYTIILLSLLMEQIVRHREGLDSMGVEVRHLEKLLAVKNRLLQDLENPPSNLELSKEFGSSSTQLSNNFKKLFGMPPHQYVLFERYKEAHRLVLETKETLSDIAQKLGFSNISHFSKGFKKQFEFSPSQLRKNGI